MKLCIFGSSSLEQAYSRNIMVLRALDVLGWVRHNCTVNAPRGGKPYWRTMQGPAKVIGFFFGLIRLWVELIKKHLGTPKYDVMIIPYPPHPYVIPGRILSAWRRRPLVIDAFIGLHDTIVADRRMLRPDGIAARLLQLLEGFLLKRADLILVDTIETAELLSSQYRLAMSKFAAIPVGIDENIWAPSPLPAVHSPLRVAFWSTFIPLHGVETVAQAARILWERRVPVKMEVWGDGQEGDRFHEVLGSVLPGNLVWKRGFFGIEELAELAKRSHCCLGIFGTTEKAGRVIPYKVYQALAAARPVITAGTPAARRVFENGRNALLVAAGDAPALADAISTLAADRTLLETLAENGRRVYREHLSFDALREQLRQVLSTAIHQRHQANCNPA